jgi:hypothetical protein
MSLAVEIGPDPDIDVRAAAAHPRREPHEKRSRRVARSLLSLKIVPVVLLTLVSSMSACVVPVAPTFQDPVGEPNVPPFIVNAMPLSGSFFSSKPTDDSAVLLTVTDQNVGDRLYYHWVIDYPPYNGSTRNQMVQIISPSANGTQLASPVILPTPCTLTPSPTIAVHQLAFILADRPFDQSNPAVLDALPMGSDGFVVYASWTFSCP